MISLALNGDMLEARVKAASSSVFYNNINRLKYLGFEFNEAEKTWVTQWSKSRVLLTLKEFGDSAAVMQPRSYLVDRQESRVGADWEAVDTTFIRSLLRGNVSLAPFDYQWKSTAYFLDHDGGINADWMGIGKTFQGIMYVLACILYEKAHRFVIIPPSHLALNWQKEFEKFTDYISPTVIRGTRVRREKLYKKLSSQDEFVAVIGQEMLRQKDLWDLDQLQALGAEVLVVDEVHHARNRETLFNKALRKLRVENKYLLTGTPFQTKAEDVFALFEIYDPTIFGSLKNFRDRYLIYQFNGKFNELVGYKNLDELHEKMSPHMIRRERKDIGIESKMLPPQIITVEMASDQEKLTAGFYEQLEELDAIVQTYLKMKELDAEQEIQLSRAQNKYKSLFTKLQEAADCAALLNDKTHTYSRISPKAELIHDIVEEKLESGEKVVIFTRFKRFLDIIVEKLQGFNPKIICHGVNDKSRQAIQDSFNTDPACNVIVCTDAAQEGINLPGGSTLIHADILWNPEAMNQRSMRIDRIDSQANVLHVIELISDGSVEQMMLGKLAKRRAQGASLIGSFSKQGG
jgi:SNF2 family DNA or RNA helicase